MRILSAFDARNRPRRTQEVIALAKLGRSTGFGLIRAMVRAGLLKRVDHGLVQLGPEARGFAFANRNPIRIARGTVGRVGVIPSERARARTERRNAGWDQRLVAMVDAAPFAKPPPYRLAVSNASLSNPWRLALMQSLKYGARTHQDKVLDVQYATAQDDCARQCAQIDWFLEGEPDALIVSASPDEDGRLSQTLHKAIERGIPVVAVDRRPADEAACVAFVTASDATIGHTSAQWMGEFLKGRGRIWMLCGLEGASPAIRRQASAQAEFQAFSQIEIEAIRHTGWTSEGGATATRVLLDKFTHPPDGVWCDSGLQGVGALRAFVEAGYQPPPHTGGDLNEMYQLAIQSHVPFAAVDYPAAMGALAISVALDILQGVAVPRRIETPLKTVLPRGCETRSVKADEWAEFHVRWDLAGDTILSQGPSLRPRRSGEA